MPITDPFQIKIGDVVLTASPLTKGQQIALLPFVAARHHTEEDIAFIVPQIAKNIGMKVDEAEAFINAQPSIAFWIIWNSLWTNSTLSEVERKNLPSSSNAQAPESTSENAPATKSTEAAASPEAKG